MFNWFWKLIWFRKKPVTIEPARLSNEAAVEARRVEAQAAREKEMTALVEWLKDATCLREEVRRPVFRQLRRFDAGTVLYRIQPQTTVQGVLDDLESRPNFFGVTPAIADTYGAGKPPSGSELYMIEGRAKRDLVFAEVATSEVFNLVHIGLDAGEHRRVGPLRRLSADPRFRSDEIGVQRWLPLEAAQALQAHGVSELDGIWDNDGADVLVARPIDVLELAVVRYDRPAKAD